MLSSDVPSRRPHRRVASVHFPQRRIDFIDGLMLLESPNIFPSFLYSNEPACVEVPPRGSMLKSQQSLSGCTCVKRRVVKGLHAVCWTPPAGGSFLITSSSLCASRSDEPDGGYLRAELWGQIVAALKGPKHYNFLTASCSGRWLQGFVSANAAIVTVIFKDRLCRASFFFSASGRLCAQSSSFVKKKWKLNGYLKAALL